MQRQNVDVRKAEWPRDLEVARTLLRAYAAHLASGTADRPAIILDRFEDELAHLPEYWSAPDAAMLLAFTAAGEACGCVAIQLLPHPPGAAELKRMWVSPNARGQGAGRALTTAAIAWAAAHLATDLLLDTHPAAMPEAASLYTALGFTPCARYNRNPVPDIVYLRRPLP